MVQLLRRCGGEATSSRPEPSAAYHQDIALSLGSRDGDALRAAGFGVFVARTGEPGCERRGRWINLLDGGRRAVDRNSCAGIVRHSVICAIIVAADRIGR